MAYDFSQAKKVGATETVRERRRAFAMAAAGRPIPLIEVRYTTHYQSDVVWCSIELSGAKTVGSKRVRERRRAFAIAAGRSVALIDVRYMSKYQNPVAWRGVAVGLSVVGVFFPIATATQATAAERHAGLQVGLVIVAAPTNAQTRQQANQNADSQAIPGSTLRLRAGYTLTKGAAAEIANRRANMNTPNL